MGKRLTVIATSVFLCAPMARAGSATIDTQARSVQASANDSWSSGTPDPTHTASPSQSFSAADFGVFNQSASALANAQSFATADQNSSLGPDSISASGHAMGKSVNFRSVGNPSNFEQGIGSSNSSFAITFTVTQPTDVTLSGLLQGTDSVVQAQNAGFTEFRLSHSDGTDVYLLRNGAGLNNGAASVPLSYSGTLSPDSYSLSAIAKGNPVQFQPNAGGDTQTSAYQFNLTGVPEPSGVLLIAAMSGPALLRRRRCVA